MDVHGATPDVLTPDQAAAYLQVNRGMVYRYIREGKLIASRLGRSYRIPRRNLDLLLWETRTRDDVVLREYSSDELDRFVEEDRLTGRAGVIAEQVTRLMERAARP